MRVKRNWIVLLLLSLFMFAVMSGGCGGDSSNSSSGGSSSENSGEENVTTGDWTTLSGTWKPISAKEYEADGTTYIGDFMDHLSSTVIITITQEASGTYDVVFDDGTEKGSMGLYEEQEGKLYCEKGPDDMRRLTIEQVSDSQLRWSYYDDTHGREIFNVVVFERDSSSTTETRDDSEKETENNTGETVDGTIGWTSISGDWEPVSGQYTIEEWDDDEEDTVYPLITPAPQAKIEARKADERTYYVAIKAEGLNYKVSDSRTIPSGLTGSEIGFAVSGDSLVSAFQNTDADGTTYTETIIFTNTSVINITREISYPKPDYLATAGVDAKREYESVNFERVE